MQSQNKGKKQTKYLVSYDITSDKRRRKVVKILEGYGFRVQYSVFECELSSKQFKELSKRLEPCLYLNRMTAFGSTNFALNAVTRLRLSAQIIQKASAYSRLFESISPTDCSVVGCGRRVSAWMRSSRNVRSASLR